MEEQNRNKETALGEARRPSSVEEAEAAIEECLEKLNIGYIDRGAGKDCKSDRP